MSRKAEIVTVTLNPAVDRVIEVEHLRLGAHLKGRTKLRSGGGKGVNVSRVLAAMDVANLATGFLGEENRDEFDHVLSQPSITDAFVLLPGATRENITLADPAHRENEMHIRDRGLEVHGDALEKLTKRLQKLSRHESTILFTGSMPPGVRPEDFVELVRAPAANGAKVGVDTSGPALQAMAGAHVKKLWLLKPNVEELEALAGQSLPSRDDQLAAARKLTANVEWILLSRGDKGAMLVGRDAAWCATVALPSEQVRNTVGCGDVLLGAFVAATHQGKSPRKALADAVATASASAATSATAVFHNELREELRTKVSIEEL